MTSSQLNYHHLRLFFEVAQSGSLRAASERLMLSQPTISSQLKSLEQSLDQSLFDRSGRSLRLTPAGEIVRDGAAEIFALGEALLRSLHEDSAARSQKLTLGITDSMPKVVAWRLIRPAVEGRSEFHLSCTEAHAEDLLGLLAAGRLDAVISDEPAPSTFPVKVFNQLMGESSLVFCATAQLAARLSKGFPQSLNGAPLLLPASRTAWRHEIERWLHTHDLHPRIVAEFDDAAFLTTAAADGLGCAPVASAVTEELAQRYQLVPIGEPVDCGLPTYLITLQRGRKHPALVLLAKEGQRVFSK
jgi:LysR family transcriptional regulator, transcriptional activator of nhaA